MGEHPKDEVVLSDVDVEHPKDEVVLSEGLDLTRMDRMDSGRSKSFENNSGDPIVHRKTKENARKRWQELFLRRTTTMMVSKMERGNTTPRDDFSPFMGFFFLDGRETI